jgi:hypothetical protein
MKTSTLSIMNSLRDRFLPECTEGWSTTIHVCFANGDAWTLDVDDCALRVTEGRSGEPLSTVTADPEAFDAVFAGRMPLEVALMSDRLAADNIVEIFKLQTVFKKASV